jgi:hypothetical protein
MEARFSGIEILVLASMIAKVLAKLTDIFNIWPIHTVQILRNISLGVMGSTQSLSIFFVPYI